MQWGSRYDRQWNEVYQAAKRYFEANGNLDIPVAYVSPEAMPWKWVRRQQYAYRNPEKSNAILSQERIELLDAIGMQWRNRTRGSTGTNWRRNIKAIWKSGDSGEI